MLYSYIVIAEVFKSVCHWAIFWYFLGKLNLWQCLDNLSMFWEKKIFGMLRQALHESPNTALQYDSLQNIFFLNNTAVPTCSIFHCGGGGGVAVVLIGGYYYAL